MTLLGCYRIILELWRNYEYQCLFIDMLKLKQLIQIVHIPKSRSDKSTINENSREHFRFMFMSKVWWTMTNESDGLPSQDMYAIFLKVAINLFPVSHFLKNKISSCLTFTMLSQLSNLLRMQRKLHFSYLEYVSK